MVVVSKRDSIAKDEDPIFAEPGFNEYLDGLAGGAITYTAREFDPAAWNTLIANFRKEKALKQKDSTETVTLPKPDGLNDDDDRDDGTKRDGENDEDDRDGGNGNRCSLSSSNLLSSVKEEKEEKENDSIDNANADPQPVKIEENGCNEGDDDVDEEIVEMPTSSQLSKELCSLSDPERYSRDEAIGTLKKILPWAYTEDSKFLKAFHLHGGVVKVLDFLEASMDDPTCLGTKRLECIEAAADVIVNVAYCESEDGNSKEVAAKIATCIIDTDNDGIATLIRASEDCFSGADEMQLRVKALECVWNAMRNVITTLQTQFSNEQAVTIFNAGVNTIANLKSIDNDIISEILDHLFVILQDLIDEKYVTKKQIREEGVLSKCVGASTGRGEETTDSAIDFFEWCRIRGLFDKDQFDYEIVLPFLMCGMKQFKGNCQIRKNVLHFIEGAWENMNSKKLFEKSVMGGLGALFENDDIDEEEMKEIRTLIVKILAPSAM